MNEHLTKSADDERKDEILLALRKASREAWELDDELRRLCVSQVRQTLSNDEANTRDKQAAAAFVLKLSEFNLDRTFLMAEIAALVGQHDAEQPIDVLNNKNFFRNEAHETFEPAD
ncbi:hypothetical protein [Blastopirellula marina]|uniref:Uncharacterized protein n=1 Tax=Blastopirellula marina TaxID=124 RepID=A0A2S8GPC4_9BACT|nr:hypothetical protein [Blastopirellula marina]PQO45854.1 hypothetical protein C5Y93_11390 [Blastopirellula marina]